MLAEMKPHVPGWVCVWVGRKGGVRVERDAIRKVPTEERADVPHVHFPDITSRRQQKVLYLFDVWDMTGERDVDWSNGKGLRAFCRSVTSPADEVPALSEEFEAVVDTDLPREGVLNWPLIIGWAVIEGVPAVA